MNGNAEFRFVIRVLNPVKKLTAGLEFEWGKEIDYGFALIQRFGGLVVLL